MGENTHKLYILQGLVSRVHRELKLNKKPNNHIKKWVKDLNRQFSKEDIQVTNTFFFFK